jgi:hypothetical protein
MFVLWRVLSWDEVKLGQVGVQPRQRGLYLAKDGPATALACIGRRGCNLEGDGRACGRRQGLGAVETSWGREERRPRRQ